MTNSKEKSNPLQYGFVQIDNPHSLTSLGIEMSIVASILRDAQWAGIQGNHAGVVDAVHAKAAIIHPSTLVIEQYAPLDLHGQKKLGGIAVVTQRWTAEKDARSILAPLTRALDHGGLLLVFEQDAGAPILDSRVKTLEHIGLVHRDVRVSNGIIVWHGHKRKEGSHETNMWDTPKAGPMAQERLTRVTNLYRQAGFRVLSTEGIERRITHSHFVPRDLDLISQGVEIVVQAPCGCEVQRRSSGDWHMVGQIACNGEHPGFAEAIQVFESQLPAMKDFTRHEPKIEIHYAIPEHGVVVGVHERADGTICGDVIQVSSEVHTVLHGDTPYYRYLVESYCASCAVHVTEPHLVDVPVV